MLAAFILLGRFDSEEKHAFEALDIQMEFLKKNVFTHFDRLAGSGIQLSRELSSIIELQLNQRSMPYSGLSDNGQALSSLQSAIIEPLEQQLLQENRSGAFVILNATVNQSIQNANYSRSGLYLQR